jgi:hypothetical protein
LVASLKSRNDESLSWIGLLHKKEPSAAATAGSDLPSRPRYPHALNGCVTIHDLQPVRILADIELVARHNCDL